MGEIDISGAQLQRRVSAMLSTAEQSQAQKDAETRSRFEMAQRIQRDPAPAPAANAEEVRAPSTTAALAEFALATGSARMDAEEAHAAHLLLVDRVAVAKRKLEETGAALRATDPADEEAHSRAALARATAEVVLRDLESRIPTAALEDKGAAEQLKKAEAKEAEARAYAIVEKVADVQADCDAFARAKDARVAAKYEELDAAMASLQEAAAIAEKLSPGFHGRFDHQVRDRGIGMKVWRMP